MPVVITLAGGFRIAFDRPPAAGDRAASFAAGLHPGFVDIASDGAAACVQINFTPLGARLALGLPMHALASRIVPLGDLPGTGLGELADRLADLPAWPDRLALAEAWAAGRIRAGLDAQGPEPRAVAAAYHLLRLSGGAPRIASVAARLGWSRKRLAARFREEIGVPPKTLARILRFRKAVRLARAGGARLGRHRRRLRLQRPGAPRARVPRLRRRHPRRLGRRPRLIGARGTNLQDRAARRALLRACNATRSTPR